MLPPGSWDIHIHVGPDVVPRADDGVSLLQAAQAAGMGGVVIKDHNGSSVSHAQALSRSFPGSTRVLGGLALNPAVGGLNVWAVEAALRQGAAIVWMPTNSSRHHIAHTGPTQRGKGAVVTPDAFPGLTVFDDTGALVPVVDEIILLLRDHQAVLGTGHLSPQEALAVVRRAKELGLTRVIATHVSLGGACGFTVGEQQELLASGAWIEQSLLAITPIMGRHAISLSELAQQIRALGCERVILSSDFGQVANGPVVASFTHWVGQLAVAGNFDSAELKRMLVDHPSQLFTPC